MQKIRSDIVSQLITDMNYKQLQSLGFTPDEDVKEGTIKLAEQVNSLNLQNYEPAEVD